jgi:hypothetical protein
VLFIVIGLVVLHESNQHHADTQATIQRIKHAEAVDLKRLQKAEYHGRIESAILGCQRVNRRHRNAVRRIDRAVPGNSPAKQFTLHLIQAVVPYESNCVTYAHLQIKAPGQHNGPAAP